MPQPRKSSPTSYGRRATDVSEGEPGVDRQKERQAARKTAAKVVEPIGELPADARQITAPTLIAGRLSIILPVLLDGANARLLRKKVLRLLPDARRLELDCDKMKWIGAVGGAGLWQIMSIAHTQGIPVVLKNVSQRVHDELQQAFAADDRRGQTIRPGEQPLPIALEDCEAELRVTGKTLRLRNTDRIDRQPRGGSWTGRFVMRLFSGRRGAA